MSNGADYSDARPGGALLASRGITSVGRYIGNVTDSRSLTRAEYDDLTAHGITVWLIREGTGTEMLNGRWEGQNQARIAQAAIDRLGLPADSVVYFTADFDVLPAQWTPCDDYLRGVQDVFQNIERIGLYAGLKYINHVQSWGGAAWFWKAGASSWSTGGDGSAIHLEQLVGLAAGIPGTDGNVIHQAIHGQIGAQAPSTPQPKGSSYVFTVVHTLADGSNWVALITPSANGKLHATVLFGGDNSTGMPEQRLGAQSWPGFKAQLDNDPSTLPA